MTATVGISPITPFQSGNYLTLAEYKNAPTAIDYDNLVVGGTSAQQDAELTNNIARASSWIDIFCNQPLIAQNFVEQQRTRITPEGYLIISPEYNNLVAVTSLNYGVTPTNMTAVTSAGLTQIWFEKAQFIYPLSELGTTYSSVGPLSFGFPPSTRSRIYANYIYVAGFCNGLISSATAGQTTLTMIDPTGLVAGSYLTIWDGVNSETVTVASTYVFGSTTVPLTSALKFTHASGVAIGTMPGAIKEAAILMVNEFLKVRGDNSLTMSITTRATGGPDTKKLIGSDMALAKELLSPFRRMR
jgi:hypothetical protein